MARDFVAIGGSLGAVDAIAHLCRALPADFPVPIAVVLHVGAHGQNLLGAAFDAHSALRVATASDGAPALPGHVYVAPADRHLLLLDGHLRLGIGPRENLSRPAIDPLLRSVGANYGTGAIGVVLSGMLNDGAAGLADLKRCGGTTVVQNPRDAVAPEMPTSALRASAVDHRCTLAELPALLQELVRAPAAPPPPVPEDVLFEIEIALGNAIGTERLARIAKPVALSCPACSGVLSRLERAPPLRYRCQVGHAYTAEALASSQEGSADEAMRIALRVLEERALLCRQMAAEAQRSGRHAAAAVSARAAAEADAAAQRLRSAVAAGARAQPDSA